MRLLTLPVFPGKKRIRKLIHQSVSDVTDKYRKDNLMLMHHYLLEQQRQAEVEESIRYARHLQNALLPAECDLAAISPDSFLLTMPRDVLNGDFAWYTRSGNKVVIAVADCTGHGIPGALMSVLGLSLLNQVVLEERNYDPSHILRRIDEKMRVTFHHTESDPRNSYDGMDIALCTIDLAKRSLCFSGAMRPMWIVCSGQLQEFTGSRYPIGGLRLESGRKYESIEMSYEPGDFLYLFTDGYTDQFGGRMNKKMTRARLRELVEMICDLPAKQQKEQLHEFFLLWKASEPQTDDATMIGMRL